MVLGQFSSCGFLQPRPLHPADLKRIASPKISRKACKQCKRGVTLTAAHPGQAYLLDDLPLCYVPQPDDIPFALRNLSVHVIHALRILLPDTGVYQHAPQGYRIHSSMIRFSWDTMDVCDKINAWSGILIQYFHASTFIGDLSAITVHHPKHKSPLIGGSSQGVEKKP